MNQYTCATIVGTACGDSAGMPFEMKKSNDPDLLNWDGKFQDGKWHKLTAGQFTDDTQMSIALAESLIYCRGYSAWHTAKSYLDWYKSGDCRGMGGTTRKAMIALEHGISHLESGQKGSDIAGNGTAMRAAPLGIYYRDNILKLNEYAELDSAITHNSFEPILGEKIIAYATALLATNQADPESLISKLTSQLPPSGVKTALVTADRLIKQNVFTETALKILGSSGYVVETVASAVYCFCRGNGFEQSIIMAVKAGGDTDTTAAICGALAGTYYGLEGIPDHYKNNVENFEYLKKLDSRLFNRAKE